MTIECLRSVHSIVYRKIFADIINMTYSCRVESGIYVWSVRNDENR